MKTRRNLIFEITWQKKGFKRKKQKTKEISLNFPHSMFMYLCRSISSLKKQSMGINIDICE